MISKDCYPSCCLQNKINLHATTDKQYEYPCTDVRSRGDSVSQRKSKATKPTVCKAKAMYHIFLTQWICLH